MFCYILVNNISFILLPYMFRGLAMWPVPQATRKNDFQSIFAEHQLLCAPALLAVINRNKPFTTSC